MTLPPHPDRADTETVFEALQEASQSAESPLANGFYPADVVAEYCELSTRTVRYRLQILADEGRVDAAPSLDRRKPSNRHTRGYAPREDDG